MGNVLIDNVKKFMMTAGQSVDGFDVRQAALYTGLQCEELAEKLEALGIASHLDDLANELKAGLWDYKFINADREELLDADMDLAWVSFGASFSAGADVAGAAGEVARANHDKGNAKDRNGKVVKPVGWRGPDHSKFICKD